MKQRVSVQVRLHLFKALKSFRLKRRLERQSTSRSNSWQEASKCSSSPQLRDEQTLCLLDHTQLLPRFDSWRDHLCSKCEASESSEASWIENIQEEMLCYQNGKRTQPQRKFRAPPPPRGWFPYLMLQNCCKMFTATVLVNSCSCTLDEACFDLFAASPVCGETDSVCDRVAKLLLFGWSVHHKH